jgi:hypothetical protein
MCESLAWVPKDTPKPVIAKLGAALVDALADLTVRRRLADPRGTEIRPGHRLPIALYEDRFKSDQQRRDWIIKTINKFVNVLRPRLSRWHDEASRL